MPMNLLLHPLHFEQLFTLMQTLSDLRINGLPHPKAQILSRRVWDILMLLPTNPTVKEKLQNITEGMSQKVSCFQAVPKCINYLIVLRKKIS